MDTRGILVLLLLLFLPVALYCLVLAQINRRTRPLAVSGQWDLVGLLFALSGFLLAVAPAILGSFAARSLLEVTLDAEESRWQAVFSSQLWHRWWALLLLLLYYGGISSAIAWLWWRRRQQLVIYNIDPEMMSSVLARVAAKLGLEQHGSGGDMVFVPAPLALLPPAEITATAPAKGQAVVAIESFPSMCHVTLHWRSCDLPLRQAIEQQLTRALAEVEGPDNPAALWFLGVSSGLFGLMFVVVVVLVLATYFPPRR